MSSASDLLWGAERNYHFFGSPNVILVAMSRLQVTVAKWETCWNLTQSCDDTLCLFCVTLWYKVRWQGSYNELRTYDTTIWIKLDRNSSKRGRNFIEMRQNITEKIQVAYVCDIRWWIYPLVSCSQLSCHNLIKLSNFPCCNFRTQYSLG